MQFCESTLYSMRSSVSLHCTVCAVLWVYTVQYVQFCESTLYSTCSSVSLHCTVCAVLSVYTVQYAQFCFVLQHPVPEARCLHFFLHVSLPGIYNLVCGLELDNTVIISFLPKRVTICFHFLLIYSSMGTVTSMGSSHQFSSKVLRWQFYLSMCIYNPLKHLQPV